MEFRRYIGLTLALLLMACLVASAHAQGGDDTPAPTKHGRKYKPPPDTSHIEVTVLKGFNKKPISNAAVIFRSVKEGKDEGNLEVKTDPDGKAVIDVIPTGSDLRVQVIASGFATFAGDYVVNEASRKIVISMSRPQAQVSTYVDNTGKASDLQPGVQEPIRPKPGTKLPTSPPPPAASTPPQP